MIASRQLGRPHSRAEGSVLYRATALTIAGAGMFGLAFAAVTTGQTRAQQLACLAVGFALAAVGVSFAARPVDLEHLFHGRPAAVAAFGLLFVTAVAAGSGMANTPLWFASGICVALGAAALPGWWWLPYGVLAALLSLAGGFATGENLHLGAQHAAGWVLFGAPLMFVNAGYVGHVLGAVILRLRRLEGVLASERDRIGTVFEALAPITALRAGIGAVLEDIAGVARRLPADEGAAVLGGVTDSRAALHRFQDTLPDSAGPPGLDVLLEELCRQCTQLTIGHGARLHVLVAPGCEQVPVRIGEAIKQIVRRALDNTDDRCAELGPHHAPVTVEIRVDRSGSRHPLRCTVTDDAGGVVPTEYGEGSEYSRRTAHNLGGVFRYEQGPQGVRAAAEFPETAGPRLSDADDQPRERITPAVARAASLIFRSTRWAAGLSMIAEGALDVTRGGLFGRAILAAVAAVAVELLLARAGLRGQRSSAAARPWVAAAVVVAIAASGAVRQADQFQTAAWAATVMLEVAWRYGWKPWLIVELARVGVVAATLQAPTAGVGFGVVSQVLFPFGVGIIAAGAHELVELTLKLETQVGSASERWTAIRTAVAAADARHDVVGEVSKAIDRVLPAITGEADLRELTVLRDRLERRSGDLTHRLGRISRTCGPARNLEATIRDTIGTMVAPARVELVADEIVSTEEKYAGSIIDRFGRRTALIELLAKVAEACMAHCPPYPWGTPRLQSLHVNVSQPNPLGRVQITVTPVPARRARRSLESEVALFAASAGADVQEGLASGTFTLAFDSWMLA
jgi:hypothetical protein